jgi:hypothetical protein
MVQTFFDDSIEEVMKGILKLFASRLTNPDIDQLTAALERARRE